MGLARLFGFLSMFPTSAPPQAADGAASTAAAPLIADPAILAPARAEVRRLIKIHPVLYSLPSNL